MLLFYFFFFSVVATVILLSVYSLLMIRKNVPIELFVEALKDENSGHFEQALIGYESALRAFKKIRSKNILRKKISEKLKALQKFIVYKIDLHFLS